MNGDVPDRARPPAAEEEWQIGVCVRLRPLDARERRQGQAVCWNWDKMSMALDASKLELRRLSGRAASGRQPRFSLPRVFPPEARTLELYAEFAGDVVASSVDGYHGSIFAYGQTSTGKTFTMQGTQQDPGVIPLAVRDVFQRIRGCADREFLLRISYLEVYNESVNDLLNPDATNLRLVEDPLLGCVVQGLREEVVASPAEIFSHISLGESHRHVGSTDYNLVSSRSHTIFRMVVESRPHDPGAEGVQVSSLSLIDLAGSECLRQRVVEKQRRHEGRFINRSLLTLGQVIYRLSEQRAADHVPYRNSKLTRILKASLGGNARVAILCTATPASGAFEETLNTLKFAKRARRIRHTARRNVLSTDRALIERYRRQIDSLQRELEQYRSVHSGGPSARGQAVGKAPSAVHTPRTSCVQQRRESALPWSAGTQGGKIAASAADETPRRPQSACVVRRSTPEASSWRTPRQGPFHEDAAAGSATRAGHGPSVEPWTPRQSQWASRDESESRSQQGEWAAEGEDGDASEEGDEEDEELATLQGIAHALHRMESLVLNSVEDGAAGGTPATGSRRDSGSRDAGDGPLPDAGFFAQPYVGEQGRLSGVAARGIWGQAARYAEEGANAAPAAGGDPLPGREGALGQELGRVKVQLARLLRSKAGAGAGARTGAPDDVGALLASAAKGSPSPLPLRSDEAGAEGRLRRRVKELEREVAQLRGAGQERGQEQPAAEVSRLQAALKEKDRMIQEWAEVVEAVEGHLAELEEKVMALQEENASLRAALSGDARGHGEDRAREAAASAARELERVTAEKEELQRRAEAAEAAVREAPTQQVKALREENAQLLAALRQVTERARAASEELSRSRAREQGRARADRRAREAESRCIHLERVLATREAEIVRLKGVELDEEMF